MFKLIKKLFFGCIIFLALAVSFSGLSIYKSIRSISRQAMALYPGDRIEALIQFAKSDTNSSKSRNTAVWALGQLGDKRAVKFLEDYLKKQYNSSGLNKKELNKALRYYKGYKNIYQKLWKKLFK